MQWSTGHLQKLTIVNRENFAPLLFLSPAFAKAWGHLISFVRLSVRPSVPPSVCHKNFNLAHIFWSIKDRALIFGMHDPCDKPFQVTPSSDLDLDLWPSSRSKLLPSGGPQFSEFACCTFYPLTWGRILNLAYWIRYKEICKKIEEWANSRLCESVLDHCRAKIRLDKFKTVYSIPNTSRPTVLQV